MAHVWGVSTEHGHVLKRGVWHSPVGKVPFWFFLFFFGLRLALQRGARPVLWCATTPTSAFRVAQSDNPPDNGSPPPFNRPPASVPEPKSSEAHHPLSASPRAFPSPPPSPLPSPSPSPPRTRLLCTPFPAVRPSSYQALVSLCEPRLLHVAARPPSSPSVRHASRLAHAPTCRASFPCALPTARYRSLSTSPLNALSVYLSTAVPALHLVASSTRFLTC